MPIIVQCENDINEGYGLVAVFYHYRLADNSMEFHYVFKVVKNYGNDCRVNLRTPEQHHHTQIGLCHSSI